MKKMTLNLSINSGNHPFIHPFQVQYLHEGKIIEIIQQRIEHKLLGCNNSCTYYTQTLLSGISVSSSLEENTTSKNRVYSPHQMVITNSKEQKLNVFLHNSSQGRDMETEKEADGGGGDFCDGQSLGKKHKSSLTITQRKWRHHKPVHLTSVNKLLQKTQNEKHQGNIGYSILIKNSLKGIMII